MTNADCIIALAGGFVLGALVAQLLHQILHMM